MTNSLPSSSITRRIRVRKEESAYVYNVLESYEGLASYSTLDHKPGDAHRDLELNVPWAFQDEVEELLKHLMTEMRDEKGDMIYELEPPKSND